MFAKCKRFFSTLLLSAILLTGCSTYTLSRSADIREQEQKIEQLEAQADKAKDEIQNLKDEATKKIEEVQKKKDDERNSRISKGGAEAVAVLGTLKAEPNKTKYTLAGIAALEVTKKALAGEINVWELLQAMEAQENLISEQADKIAEGQKHIEEQKAQIDAARQKEAQLEAEKQKIREEVERKVAEKAREYDGLIDQKNHAELSLKEQNQRLLDASAEDAAKWRKENAWYNKINPFHGLFDNVKKLFVWLIIFLVIGGLLKLASIFFPGVNVIQVVVKSIGRVIGGIIKMFTFFIPDVHRGQGVVPYEQYKIQETIADNSVGAIHQFQQRKPELYEAELKKDLKDWNKEDKVLLDPIIEEKKKKLNLV